MPKSVPVALQAVLWPLVGAVIVVAMNRLLPNWIGRLLVLAASVASLVALWSLGGQAAVWLQGYWEPFTFLRAGPAVLPDPLGLFTGISLAAFTAVAAVGIRGSQHPRTTWHGLNLVLLAGCLVMALAANLLTLALGSGLVDLALLAMAASAVGGAGQGQRVTWRMCVPGLVSTLLLFVAALRMDTQSGTLSLRAQQFLPEVLALLGVAGLLRLMVFPFYPRDLKAPEQAASLIASIGAGVYLLARVQSLGPVLAGQQWFVALGAVALLAGGWLSWTAGTSRSSSPKLPDLWTGMAIQQTGMAVVFVMVFPGVAPWALVGLVLAMGLLAIWWDATLERSAAPSSPRQEWIREKWDLGWSHLRSWVRGAVATASRGEGNDPPSVPLLECGSHACPRAERRAAALGGGRRLRGSWPAKPWAAVLPALALASLAGVPLTVGAVTRWHLYGTLLGDGRSTLLIALWVADTLLAGGLWLAWKAIGRQAVELVPRVAALVAMAVLATCSIVLGLAPRILTGHVGLTPAPPPGVSVWGLGLISFLPWLLGAWLARVVGAVGGYLQRLRRPINLDVGFGAVDWLGQKLVSAVYWLGSIGEGEGWWGWALIILALGALYLAVR